MVAHDDGISPEGGIGPGAYVVGDEPGVAASQLLVHARARVARILLLGERGGVEPVDLVRAALVLVAHTGPQPVDVLAAAHEAEVSEHVVEGAVLHHEHDEVLDSRERLHRFVDLDLDEAARRRPGASEEGAEQPADEACRPPHCRPYPSEKPSDDHALRRELVTPVIARPAYWTLPAGRVHAGTCPARRASARRD